MAAAQQKPATPATNDTLTEDRMNLAYWMGRVDASLTSIQKSIDAHFSENEARWDELDAWRKITDASLQRGANRFLELDRRLDGLEECNEDAAAEAQKATETFGTWPWFRDKYLEKGAMSHMCIDATVRTACDLGFQCR